MSIQIKAIHNQIDINLPNEPFKIWGQMIPSLENGKWDYTIKRFEQTSTQCFPNENYDYDDNAIFKRKLKPGMGSIDVPDFFKPGR